MPQGHDAELSDQNFTKLRSIIHEHTGITIADGRKSLLVSRLRSRLREVEDPDFKSYIARVTRDSGELQELINRVTTNKTYFYRTPRIWEHFRTVAVPEFLEKKAMRPMRVWSAAASTGEEAHTIGTALESVRQSEDRFEYKILGTDISSRVLKHAEAGVYERPALVRFQKDEPTLFAAHMQGDDNAGFQVSPAIKQRISFKLHNLQKRLTGAASFDVVFLRNVLIYFSPEDQENILRHVHAMMPPEGTLYIGESETVTRLDTEFEILEPMIYRPRAGVRKPDA